MATQTARRSKMESLKTMANATNSATHSAIQRPTATLNQMAIETESLMPTGSGSSCFRQTG
jgi:hypothetical protein